MQPEFMTDKIDVYIKAVSRTIHLIGLMVKIERGEPLQQDDHIMFHRRDSDEQTRAQLLGKLSKQTACLQALHEAPPY